MSVVVGRGRGRGRGLGKGWINTFQPKPCPVSEQEIVADEKPKISNNDIDSLLPENKVNTDAVDKLSEKLLEDILHDEKPASIQLAEERRADNIDICGGTLKTAASTQLDSVLVNAINAKEFTPKFVQEQGEHELNEYSSCNEFDEEQVTLGVLNDVMVNLIEDPGDFDNVIHDLTEHLKQFLTKEETLHCIVSCLIEKALEDGSWSYIVSKLSHHFDESGQLQVENGATFRRLFLKRCKEKFEKAKELMKMLNDDANVKIVSSTALMFGELCCNMKLKGKTNPIYKDVVFKFVDMFLVSETPSLLLTLTRLLKLVGPDLDVDRPKDVEVVFDKLKDFYLDKKSAYLPEHIRNSVWHVYKLHTRDWDRRSSAPPSPALVEDQNFMLPMVAQNALAQKLNRKISGGVPDWNDYYAGDDADLYDNYMPHDINTQPDVTDDEELDAFEEFLRQSGQL